MGAAIYSATSQSYIEIINSTIAYNEGFYETGCLPSAIATSLPPKVKSCLIAYNYPLSFNSLPLSQGHNVYSDSLFYIHSTDIDNVPPSLLQLEPLGYYGGTTKTILPKSSSIAINAGNLIDSNEAQNIDIVGIRDAGAAENCAVIIRDSVLACKRYLWRDSVTYSTNVDNIVFTKYNVAENGCDSIWILNLQFSEIDTTIWLNIQMLNSNEKHASGYQWLNCDSNFAIISGQTGYYMWALNNGSYAVEITKNGCVDTSICFQINNISIEEEDFSNFLVTPNPTSGEFKIEFKKQQSIVTIRLLSSVGEEIWNKTSYDMRVLYLELNQPSGIYIIETTDENGAKKRMKIIKE